MIAKQFRRDISKVLLPIGKSLKEINPNHITIISIPLAIIAGLFIYFENYLMAFLFFSLSSLMDVLDGLIAKTNNKKSDFGNYLDAVSDRINELIIFSFLAFSGYTLESFFAFSLSLMVSYAKARAEMIKSLNNMDWPSLGERAERLIIVSLMLFVKNFFPSIHGFDTISLFLYILIAVGIVGFLQRFYFAYTYLKNGR